MQNALHILIDDLTRFIRRHDAAVHQRMRHPDDVEFIAVLVELLLKQPLRTCHALAAVDEVEGDQWDPEVLAKISGHVYETLTAADPEAVWLQVGWPLYHDMPHWPPQNVEAYLKAVPQGKVVMLDYFCDEAEIYAMNKNFYGQPYFFCFLGNFGGNTNLSGDFYDLSEKIERVFAQGGDNLLGLGGTPEGFGVSQFLYEYLFDRAWTGSASDSAWVANLADRRFGGESEYYRNAWKALTEKIYTGGATYSGICPVPCIHPCFEGHWRWTTLTDVPYTAAAKDSTRRQWPSTGR